MERLENINVGSVKALVTPRVIKQSLPITEAARETVVSGREVVHRILNREDPRFLAVVGPCSIHDSKAALDYAARLKALSEEIGDRLFVVMRTYFEKPRTTTGWKGLINDPYLDGSYDLNAGLHKAREILMAIAEMGLPAATEMLEPIVPQYIADLITTASIGARTTESQTHREMASGLSMPVGFKNGTDGNLTSAINALLSACHPHHFLGIDGEGQTCVLETRGNPWGHIILRGGGGRPNYDVVSVSEAEEALEEAGLTPLILVDCSHENCGKRPERQGKVLRHVIQQRLDGTQSLIGVMIESNLEGGRQEVPKNGAVPEYGLSITDPCLDWESTAKMLREAHDRLGPLFEG
ncbi:MAG: 3-deoxy-7-phosphoheptulonate synthase [bacterium]|nr:3-deoxy-7-phosphoheptulonate synthase [bacterium]